MHAKTWLELISPLHDSDAAAVVTETATWSGSRLISRAANASEFLDSIGAPVGVPVAALLTSTADAFALTIGAAASDRALAPLGPKLTVKELAPCVVGVGAAIIVAEESVADLAAAVAKVTGARVAILPTLIDGEVGAVRFHIAPDRPAAILHTSGTTGLPKPVVYQQGRLVDRVRVNSRLLELGPGSTYATASPFHHIAGIGNMFVVLGSGAALLSMPKFDRDAWRGLAARGATHALIVPTMIEMLLTQGALALPGLRVLQYGASPIHPDTLAQMMAVMGDAKFVNMFGQTEGSPISCLTSADHVLAANGRSDLLESVGRAVAGVEMMIADPGPDGVGEVHARAAHFFKPDADGWLRTGDLGRIDSEGYLFLSGRKGDKIIRGGENIYPIEVEQVVASHPAIADVCVFAIPDRKFGEIVGAAMVSVDGVERPSVAELSAFARQSLGGFKVPTVWEWSDSLPRNAAGKVLRREIVARYAGVFTDGNQST